MSRATEQDDQKDKGEFDPWTSLIDDFDGIDYDPSEKISKLVGQALERTDSRVMRRMIDAVDRREEIVRALAREYDDEQAIELARKLFEAIYQLFAHHCHSVYRARIAEDTDEARAERRRFERLDRELTESQKATYVRKTAEALWREWLKKAGPNKAIEIIRTLQPGLLEHAVMTTILTTQPRLPPDATLESWDETLRRNLDALTADGSHAYVYASHIPQIAAKALRYVFPPAEMPFAELRFIAGISWLEYLSDRSVPEGVVPAELRGVLDLVVDHLMLALAQYLGGVAAPVGSDGQRAEISVKAVRGQRRELAVGEVLPPELLKVFDPQSVTPTLERIREERNETKAKVFVGTLALACQPGVDPENFYVPLADLVRLVTGYERTEKNKTKNAYYWRKSAEIVTYLTLDLAYTDVRMFVKLPQHKQPVTVEEYLMHRPRPTLKRVFSRNQFIRRVVSLVNRNANKELVTYIKDSRLEGFFLDFPKRVLDAFGTRRGKGEPNALERVPMEVFKLKGPAF